MVMWKLKSCLQCGGDMFIGRDMYGWYAHCLQCAYQHELKDLAEFKETPVQREKELSRAGETQFKRRTVS